MRERKLLKGRVEARQTKRITSLLGLFIFIAQLSKIIAQKCEEEARNDSRQLQAFEEKLENNLAMLQRNSYLDPVHRRKNITGRKHGSKTRLKNFSVALSAMISGIMTKKQRKWWSRWRNKKWMW